jgi:hypothetical protein
LRPLHLMGNFLHTQWKTNIFFPLSANTIKEAGKEGNYLLGVGPALQRTMQPEFVERLQASSRSIPAKANAIHLRGQRILLNSFLGDPLTPPAKRGPCL